MTARDFLVRGLLAGLLAGLAAFAVGFTVGERPLQAAIDVEESTSATQHAGSAAHAQDSGAPQVTRSTQRSWGLLVGTLLVGLALGGLLALVAALALGRLGSLPATASTAVVSTLAFVAVGVVPYLKYPATPPGANDPSTIDSRTATYFAFLAVSVIAASVAAVVARRLRLRGTVPAVVLGLVTYVVLVGGASLAFPGGNVTKGFPADVLWDFRVAALLVQIALWGVLGVALTFLMDRLNTRVTARQARRDLAASL